MECYVVYDANHQILGIGKGEDWLRECLANVGRDAHFVKRLGKL